MSGASATASEVSSSVDVSAVAAGAGRGGIETTHVKDEEATPCQKIESSCHPTEKVAKPSLADGKPDMGLLHEIAFVALCCFAQLFAQAGLGQSIAPLEIIGSSLGAESAGEQSWIPAAFSLTVGTFILPSGRWGDLFGHRRLFIIGWLVFAVGSLMAGLAALGSELHIFFDVCRAIQGLGAALVLPSSLALMGMTYPPGPRKNLAFCVFGGAAPNGFLVGAVFASLFAQLAWWPWAYWSMSIACVVLAAFAFFLVPYHAPRPRRRDISLWTALDGNATIVGVVGLVLFNFAWNQAPVVGWSTPYVYVILIISLPFLCLFPFVESRAAAPLVPIRSIQSLRSVLFTLACLAAGWACFGIWLFETWRFLKTVRLYSPLAVTAQFAPCGISGLVAALTTTKLLPRLGPSFTMLLALSAFLVGTCLAGTAPVEQIYWGQIFFSTCVQPWGMDMSFPAGAVILSDSLLGEQGVAASLVLTVVNYSVSIGLGVAATAEYYVTSDGAPGTLLEGLRAAYYVGIGFAAFGTLIAALFCAETVWRRRRRSGNEPRREGEKVRYVEH